MADKTKYWRDPKWMYDIMKQEWTFFPGGYHEPTMMVDEKEVKKWPTITMEMANMLIKEMSNQGQLPFTTKMESREEDLKIVHRLIDLMEKEKK